MAPYVGRLGWAGIAIEATPGVPSNPTDYIPYTQNTMQGRHTPLADVQARGMREREFSSVVGKKWGEGDIEALLDPKNSGYFFKMAIGAEATATPGSGVTDHTFTIAESSTPTAASVYFDKGAFRELYPYTVADQLDLDVSDGLALIKITAMSQFPFTSTSGTNTTASGTVFTFKDLDVRFGSTLAAAQAATPTKVTSFKLSIKNNAEPIYRSGSTVPDSYSFKGVDVTGSYGVLLESQTVVNNYYNLTKQYMIFTFTGNGIGAGLNEKITITLYRSRINEQPIETGIDSLFAITSNFVGEFSKADSKTLDVVLRNSKATAY